MAAPHPFDSVREELRLGIENAMAGVPAEVPVLGTLAVSTFAIPSESQDSAPKPTTGTMVCWADANAWSIVCPATPRRQLKHPSPPHPLLWSPPPRNFVRQLLDDRHAILERHQRCVRFGQFEVGHIPIDEPIGAAIGRRQVSRLNVVWPKAIALHEEDEPLRGRQRGLLRFEPLQERLKHDGPGPKGDPLEECPAAELIGSNHVECVVEGLIRTPWVSHLRLGLVGSFFTQSRKHFLLLPNQFTDRMVAAAAEVFGKVELLAGGQLIFIGDVWQAGETWLVSRFELVGENVLQGRRSPNR